MRFSRLVFSSLVIVVALLSGCTKKGSGLEYGLDVKETLRVNLLSEPPSLDWSKSTDTTSSMVEFNIMEGLVEYDLKDSTTIGYKGALIEVLEATNQSIRYRVIRNFNAVE